MEAVFRELHRARSAQRGRTVLLSSHILSEVEALCDRVTIIRDGRTVETGTLAELRHLTRTSITAELAGPPTAWPACPACTTCDVDGQPGALRGRHRRSSTTLLRQLDRGRRAQPDQPAADARGAVPAALRGRWAEARVAPAADQDGVPA